MSMDKKPVTPYHPIRIGAAQIRLLERLCNACAVSGDEGEVRKIVLEQVRPVADEVKVDALGNVLAVRGGTGEAPRLRVMLAAHMDEVGLMLTQDEGDGIFRFEIVGGIDTRQLAGKTVWIGHDHIPGVIGAKPIHLTEEREMESPISIDTLRIDVGPGGDKVKIGDRAAFATSFQRVGPSLRAKALDDRLGVAVLIELLKNPRPAWISWRLFPPRKRSVLAAPVWQLSPLTPTWRWRWIQPLPMTCPLGTARKMWLITPAWGRDLPFTFMMRARSQTPV